MIKKIVIIGPESTGKSSLCAHLAAHYHTIWGEEFAREYLTKHGTNYTFADLLTIAKGQIAVEETAISKAMALFQNKQSNAMVFLDTDMHVMKVWCEYVFGQCHQYILDQIVERKYDLYLLCNVDLPWEKDDLREYPDEKPRQELFNIYKDILSNQSVPWFQINGIGTERMNNAIAIVDKFLGDALNSK